MSESPFLTPTRRKTTGRRRARSRLARISYLTLGVLVVAAFSAGKGLWMLGHHGPSVVVLKGGPNSFEDIPDKTETSEQ